MTGFAESIKSFTVKVETNSRAIFTNVVSHAQESIIRGSSVTGAPGQPVDHGELRNSWQAYPSGPNEMTISTNLKYAIYNEEGVTEDGSPYVQRSPVGGRGSVRLTVLGFSRIVAVEAAKVVGNG